MKPATTLTVALAAATLAGCNMVTSEKPIFTLADRAGAPPIRPGVWRDEKADCAFDETQPQSQWPKCAGGQAPVAVKPFWLEVAGDPDILQTPVESTTMKQAGINYLYVAYRPLKLDDQGRVIAMKKWTVRCGPPPTPEEMEEENRKRPEDLEKDERTPDKKADLDDVQETGHLWRASYQTASNDDDDAKFKAQMEKMAADAKKLQAQMAKMLPTKHPLPGLTMNEAGGCAATTPEAVRNAAKLSEAWADDDSVSHWVRDPIDGDKDPATAKSIASAFDRLGGGDAEADAKPGDAAPPTETPMAAPDEPTQSPPPPRRDGPPMLGVSLLPPPGDLDALIVGEVVAGSAAQRAGIRAGDVIRSINGRTLLTPRELSATIRKMKPGETAQVVVTRNGVDKTLTLGF